MARCRRLPESTRGDPARRARPHRAPRAGRRRRARVGRRVRAPSSAPAPLVRVVAPWLCEELEELAVSGESTGARATTPVPATSTTPGSSSSATGDAAATTRSRPTRGSPRGCGASTRVPAAGGTATLPPTARVDHAPTARVTVAAHAPGDPGPRRDGHARPSTGCSPAGALDLRRRPPRPGAGLGRARRGGPGRRRAAHRAGRASCSRRPTSWCSTGSPRAGRRPAARHRAGRRRRQGPGPARPGAGRGSTTCSSTRRSPAAPSCGSRAATPTCSGAVARSGCACEAHGIRGRGRARRDERGRGARGGRHPRHPPGRGPRVHRRHRPRRAARRAARHRPHRRAAHGRRAAGPLGAVLLAAGRPASCRSRSSSGASARPARDLRHPRRHRRARDREVGVENPAVVVVGDVVRAQPRPSAALDACRPTWVTGRPSAHLRRRSTGVSRRGRPSGASTSADERAQHVLQDAAVAVVVGLAGGVDAHDARRSSTRAVLAGDRDRDGPRDAARR